MSSVYSNVSLKKYNTFGIDVNAKIFIEINKIEDLIHHLELIKKDSCLTIGGGSNILLTNDVNIPVVKNNLKGLNILKQDEQNVWIEVASGEIWHDFVLHTVRNGWSGIENLALIPGTVGAAPIQNIGAYGVEVKDVIESVQFYDWNTDTLKSFSKENCHFGYRDSVFKNELKGSFFITSVIFKLSKNKELNISYKALSDYFLQNNNEPSTIEDIANAVINIRQSKLPDPKKIGNGGSFFKNPVISNEHFQKLRVGYPNIPFYEQQNGKKIPAAWLIEQCGWKGFRQDDYGVHPLQALVLVNYGNANGKEILRLSDQIIHSVQERFNIQLEREVQIVP